jgi:hypothetical protein
MVLQREDLRQFARNVTENVRIGKNIMFVKTPHGELAIDADGAWIVGEEDARLGDQSGVVEAINYAEKLLGLREF